MHCKDGDDVKSIIDPFSILIFLSIQIIGRLLHQVTHTMYMRVVIVTVDHKRYWEHTDIHL